MSSTDGLQIEKIAAQRPDLILAVYSGMTKKEYTALSKIAPVVGQPKGEVDYGSSWQEETTITGKAVGRNAKAAELVSQTEKLIADAAAAHPEFKGKTAANVSDYQGIFVYGPQDVRTRMLEDLGFVYPQALRKAFPKDFGGQLSDEKVDAVDVDALIWFADGDRSVARLKENGVYGKLAVRKQGRDVFVLPDDRVYEATSFPPSSACRRCCRRWSRAWSPPSTATRTRRPTSRSSRRPRQPPSPRRRAPSRPRPPTASAPRRYPSAPSASSSSA